MIYHRPIRCFSFDYERLIVLEWVIAGLKRWRKHLRVVSGNMWGNFDWDRILVPLDPPSNIRFESINGTVQLNETNHCAHVRTLFSTKEGNRPLHGRREFIVDLMLYRKEKEIVWPSNIIWYAYPSPSEDQRSRVSPPFNSDNQLLDLIDYLVEKDQDMSLQTEKQVFQWWNITQANIR